MYGFSAFVCTGVTSLIKIEFEFLDMYVNFHHSISDDTGHFNEDGLRIYSYV